MGALLDFYNAAEALDDENTFEVVSAFSLAFKWFCIKRADSAGLPTKPLFDTFANLTAHALGFSFMPSDAFETALNTIDEYDKGLRNE